MTPATNTVEGVEALVAETLRALLLRATIEKQSNALREEISEDFAKDTVNLVLTLIANHPSIMDEPIQEDPFAHVGPRTLQ